MMKAPDLLAKARETMLERSVERDVKEERAMKRTVDLFNAAFGTSMTEYQGWMFMVFLKLARAQGGAYREDDYLDMAAYVALAGECLGNEVARSFTPPAELMETLRAAGFAEQGQVK
jgi:hypothetical protein